MSNPFARGLMSGSALQIAASLSDAPPPSDGELISHYRAWRVVVDLINAGGDDTPERETLWRRYDDLLEKVMGTQAVSIAGLLVKIRVAWHFYATNNLEPEEEKDGPIGKARYDDATLIWAVLKNAEAIN